MNKPKMFAVLPTLLTLGNAACGFGSITFAAKVGPTNLGGNELFLAALLILLGMLFDALDGSMARLTRQTSEFGALLDSLCDGITFGVAPAFLMLQFSHPEHGHLVGRGLEQIVHYRPRLLWMIAVLFMLCVLLRLARFNVETDEDDSHDFFSGLPSPAAAGMVAAFPIAMGLNERLNELAVPKAQVEQISGWLIPGLVLLLPLITLAAACLMVSRIRYAHVFNQIFRGQRSRKHLIQLVFTLAAIFWMHEMAVPLIFCYYVFAAPLRAFWAKVVAPRLYKSQRV